MRPGHYNWLVIVEGNTDVKVFKDYLDNNSIATCDIQPAGGGGVLTLPSWSDKLTTTLITDLARQAFMGVILVVDSDEDNTTPFNGYVRSDSPGIRYIGNKSTPVLDPTGTYWELDSIIGHKNLPLRGINVPFLSRGGLESELLSAYGFPTAGQPQYNTFINIIKDATTPWGIPNNNDGTPWWAANETAKMDKFIYAALKSGFVAVKRTPTRPPTPGVITRIQKTIES